MSSHTHRVPRVIVSLCEETAINAGIQQPFIAISSCEYGVGLTNGDEWSIRCRPKRTELDIAIHQLKLNDAIEINTREPALKTFIGIGRAAAVIRRVSRMVTGPANEVLSPVLELGQWNKIFYGSWQTTPGGDQLGCGLPE